MSWDVDEKEFYETFAEIESEHGIEDAKRWAWSALDWTQKELRKKEDGVKEERAAVVAYLRDEAYLKLYEALDACALRLYEATPEDVSDHIERGEHRREEKE